MYIMNKSDRVPTGTLIEYLIEKRDCCVLLNVSLDVQVTQNQNSGFPQHPFPVSYRKILQGGM